MTEKQDRLISLDAFRGATIALMILVNTPGTWAHVYAPLRHAKWHGCTLTDLVFPFFLFIIGVSMRFSFEKSQPTSLALPQFFPSRKVFFPQQKSADVFGAPAGAFFPIKKVFVHPKSVFPLICEVPGCSGKWGTPIRTFEGKG